MTPFRQFIAVEFRRGDGKPYTFHNEGEPVEIGDRVVVAAKHGARVVTVVALIDEPPAFETKPIKGLETPKTEAEGKLL